MPAAHRSQHAVMLVAGHLPSLTKVEALHLRFFLYQAARHWSKLAIGAHVLSKVGAAHRRPAMLALAQRPRALVPEVLVQAIKWRGVATPHGACDGTVRTILELVPHDLVPKQRRTRRGVTALHGHEAAGRFVARPLSSPDGHITPSKAASTRHLFDNSAHRNVCVDPARV